MTLGGLFSGIGGFELAAKWAGIDPVWSNEIDEYCCQVLRKNFTHEIINADIREIGEGRKHKLQPVDIICGGFPCQPFSTAGRRKGQDDNRYLWPEMLRTIREIKPSWVVGENVAGITSMDDGGVFDKICTSLEDEGYNVETYNIPACSVGAPHRRERIWIVAHSKGEDDRGYIRKSNCRSTQQFGECVEQGVTPNTTGKRLEGATGASVSREGDGFTWKAWERDWFQTATTLCRVDDGIPRRVDRSKRIKALGNAIVPQVAQVIFESIIQFENSI